VFFYPADKQAIEFASSLLENNKFTSLPAEYVEILNETDGLIWNGVELFGTKPHNRESYEYIFPSIIDVNTEFSRRDILNKRVILGHAAEEAFVYDSRFKQFQVVRRMDFTVENIFPTLYDALYSFVDSLL